MDSITLLALNLLRNHPDLLNIRDISPPDACPICYEDIFPSTLPYVVLSCNHIFHYSCIQQHLNINENCPLCRCIVLVRNNTDSVVHETSSSQAEEEYIFMDEFQEDENESQDPTYMETSEETSIGGYSPVTRSQQRQRRNRQSRVEGILQEIMAEPDPIDLEVPELVTHGNSTELGQNNTLDDSPYEIINMDTHVDSSSLNLNDNIANTVTRKTIRSSKGFFARLIQKVVNAEERADRENQETILCYYRFGKAMNDRFNEIKETDNCPTQTARIKLNEEIKSQIPESISSVKYNKMKEKASKIYDLFNAIGEDKIRMIRSYSADSISRLTRSEINHIIQHSH